MCDFEKKVKDNLIECGINPAHNPRLGVAVSGGADSISLLLALSEFITPLYVITINHNIRPSEESRGDVDFVLKVCEELDAPSENLDGGGRKIICDVVELERGAVDKEAERRGGGIEDAARSLRYAAFEKFIAEKELNALCLAHNKNDQLETLLMRFLQGSPAEAAAGIRARRGMFVRPLLSVARCDVEQYVRQRGFSWRTDKTNYETDYLRNKIRLKLLPFLDSEFPGWQTAVLSGAEKAREDAELIKSFSSKISLTEDESGCIKISLNNFMSLPDALKYRILLEACNKAGETSRIPHQFLKDVISSLSAQNFNKHFGQIDIIKKKDILFVKKHSKDSTDYVFSDIIDRSGEYEFPFGLLTVFNIEESENCKSASLCVNGFSENGNISSAEKIELPFVIRSLQLDDTTTCADGSEKKVSDILSDWHVPAEKKALIPVIQILNDKSQRIVCVFARFLGYKDWIVKL